MTTPPERIEEFFTEQDEHGYSVDTAASGGDLNNKEYVRDYLTPKLHKLLHQELQKAREEQKRQTYNDLYAIVYETRDVLSIPYNLKEYVLRLDKELHVVTHSELDQPIS